MLPSEEREEEENSENPLGEEEEECPGCVKIEEKFRTIGLFGEINEEMAAEVVFGIHSLASDKEAENPIEIIISTPGGHASDMFAIYDIMRYHRGSQQIDTFALGKVMSAGVLLLAAGTKGQRKIGKFCRVMIHQCIAGNMGSISTLKNEMKEINILQGQYLEALAAETNLTLKQVKRLISKNQNIYLSPEEAIKYGIADIIV